MGRLEKLVYDNRNWKGTITLICSMLIGLCVGFKGFDELPDLQNERRAASLTVYKARRSLDKQLPRTTAFDRARDQLKIAEDRLLAANMGIRLSNITVGVGLTTLAISLVLYLRRSQGLTIVSLETQHRDGMEVVSPAPAPTRLAA